MKDILDNETIWEDSFWVFRNTLMSCVTINSPIESLITPNEAQAKYNF